MRISTLQSWQSKPRGSFNSFHMEYCRSMEGDLTRKYFCGARLWSKLHFTNPWAGGYYPVGLSFEEINRTYVFQSRTFQKTMFKKPSKTSRSINQHYRPKDLFLRLWKCLFVESFPRAGADVLVAANGWFQIAFLRAGHLGPMVFWLCFGPFKMVCRFRSSGGFEKSDQWLLNLRELFDLFSTNQ